MNFLFDGILIIVSSTAPMELSKVPDAVGCYDYTSNKTYIMPEYKHEEFYLYHETGHAYYNRQFFGKGANDHIQFWNEVNLKMGYDPIDTPAWEVMANYYAWSKVKWNRQVMPKEVEWYFKYYR